MQCPMCGSENLTETERVESRPVPFGRPALCNLQVVTCGDCGEHGDFGLVNDERTKLALEQAVAESVDMMLDRLKQIGLTNAYVERAFDLPARTIARWKRGERSATVVALLRLLCRFPWLVEVADENFEQTESDKQVALAFFEISERVRAAFAPPSVSWATAETTTNEPPLAAVAAVAAGPAITTVVAVVPSVGASGAAAPSVDGTYKPVRAA